MSASAPLHAPTGTDAAQLAEPHPANNDGRDSRVNARLRVHERDDAKQPAQSPTLVSPAMRLYRHALESIFSMLQLHDLTQILAVSREWAAAVRSMKSIDATIEHEGKEVCPFPPMDRVVASPLPRHLAAIHITNQLDRGIPLTSESLTLLAQHAPNLTSLWCELTLTPAAPLLLPAKLMSLQLTFADECSDAEINSSLSALAAFPSLSHLLLELMVGMDLSLLSASRSLTDLTLQCSHRDAQTLSDCQVAQIRSSLGHLVRFCVGFMRPVDIHRILQPPVHARWQDIGFMFANAETGDLLATLPALTTLKLHYNDETPHADFLSKLPLLSSLKLICSNHIPPAPLLASLLPRIGLTELDLNFEFNSAQVGALLAALKQLRKLKLESELETLECFASGPATRTLEDLSLFQSVPLPQSELVHLYVLQGLRNLEIEGVFESLDDAALASLSPPTARLPRLTRFVFLSEDRDPVQCTGPSFD